MTHIHPTTAPAATARVNLVYRALPALRDIDWTVEHGQQWACLGPNGAGKTSLARVVSGQATHFSGELQRSRTAGERVGLCLLRAGPGPVCARQKTG